MRVLMVNRAAAPHTGGANRVVVETASLLRNAGHDVSLAFWDITPPEAPCECIRIKGDGDVPGEELHEVARRMQPDVIQCHMMENSGLEQRLAIKWPTCHYIHDQGWICSGGNRMHADLSPCHRPHGAACLAWHYLKGCGGRNPLGNWLRWQRVQSHSVVNEGSRVRFQVASRFMKAGLMENGMDEGRIDLVPLFAMPSKAFEPVQRGRWLVASRLVHGKGVDMLLLALSLIKDRGWTLVVAGDGPQRDALKRLSRKLDLDAHVEWLGEISPQALDAQYRRCSLVISPTLRPEPFGLVGPEAMAHGRAVVAFDGGATPEWLVHKENGLVIRDRTPHALAQALEELLSEPELAERMGINAHAKHSRFTPQRYLEILMASFTRTMQTHSENAR